MVKNEPIKQEDPIAQQYPGLRQLHAVTADLLGAMGTDPGNCSLGVGGEGGEAIFWDACFIHSLIPYVFQLPQ